MSVRQYIYVCEYYVCEVVSMYVCEYYVKAVCIMPLRQYVCV